MDRIRKALDLAREERDRGVEELVPRSATFERQPAAGEKTAAAVPTSIVYTRTKVFRPDVTLLESKRVVSDLDQPQASSAFRMLRTQVVQRMDENSWTSIAVLSPGADDGKTTTAINLAVSLAQDRRHTVLLVDGDLTRPSIGDRLGIRPERGLDDVLRGDASVEECLYHPDGYDRLVILPARGRLANSSEALAGPVGRRLLADLRSRYPDRIIIFDLPPVLLADDALAVLPLIECGLVVISERGTRRDDLLRCMELLRRTPIVGTVLNKASEIGLAYG